MKINKSKKERRLFTKEDIKTVLNLWDTKTTAEIAKELNRPISSIVYASSMIRKAGYDLPKKRKIGIQNKLVTDVLRELKFIK